MNPESMSSSTGMKPVLPSFDKMPAAAPFLPTGLLTLYT